MPQDKSCVAPRSKEPVADGELTQTRETWEVLESEEGQQTHKHQEPLESADEAKQGGALERDVLAIAAGC